MPDWFSKGLQNAGNKLLNFTAAAARRHGSENMDLPSFVGGATGLALIGAGKIMEISDKWGGVAWRGEFRFKDGELLGLFYKGRRVDMDAMIRGGTATANQGDPSWLPTRNHGSPALAASNFNLHLMFGANPFDIAATSGGKNHGNNVIAMANTYTAVFKNYGVLRPLDQIQSKEHVAVLLQRLERSLANDPVTLSKVMDQLANNYDLNFGNHRLNAANHRHNPSRHQPDDLDFVRSVFIGDYRRQSDM